MKKLTPFYISVNYLFFAILCLLAQVLNAQCTESTAASGATIIQFDEPRQSFTAGCDGELTEVLFHLYATSGAPGGTNMSVDLMAIGSGICSPGSVLASSNSVPLVDDTDHTFTFPTPPSITNGTEYVLEIKGGSPGLQGLFGASDTYPGGTSSFLSNVTNACAVNSFDFGFTAEIEASSLPIELIDFRAKVTGDQMVPLEWETAWEFNNDFFTVQRSADGNKWEDVAQVNGNNSATIKRYELLDNAPLEGRSYYRVKQTDFDGKYAFSDVVSVKLLQEQRAHVELYPNPTSSYIKIQGVSKDNILIHDLLGRNRMSDVNINCGPEGSCKIDLTGLKSGIYLLLTQNTVTKILKN